MMPGNQVHKNLTVTGVELYVIKYLCRYGAK